MMTSLRQLIKHGCKRHRTEETEKETKTENAQKNKEPTDLQQTAFEKRRKLQIQCNEAKTDFAVRMVPEDKNVINVRFASKEKPPLFSDVPMVQATLMEMHKADETVTLIRHTPYWGYVIATRKAQVVLHGHGEKSLDICLYGVSGTSESTDQWGIEETATHDLVFLTPTLKRRATIFLRQHIEDAITKKTGTVYPFDKWHSCDALPVTVSFPQVAMQGNSLHFAFRASFEFFYRPEQLAEGVAIQEAYESSTSVRYCDDWKTRMPKEKDSYRFRGEWKCSEKYDEMDMVSHLRALYIAPPEQKGPLSEIVPAQAWTLFRRAPMEKDKVKGRIDRVSSCCVIKQKSHWEMVCGHQSGVYTKWSIPTAGPDLLIQPIERDQVFVVGV